VALPVVAALVVVGEQGDSLAGAVGVVVDVERCPELDR